MPALDEEKPGASNENPEGFRDADFSNRKPKSSSFGFDEDDVKSNGSMKIDNRTVEQMGSLKMNQELENPETRINGSRRSIWSSIRTQRNDHLREVDEGPSNYHFRSGNVYVEPEVEDDRVELLRKLDELKDQIVRSRPLGDQSKEKASFFNYPIRSQIVRRAPFDQNAYHGYFPGRYFNKDSGDFRKFHHPSCSCLVCYTNCHQAGPPPPPLPPVYYRHDHKQRFSWWSGDLPRPRRGILAAGGRRCRPVAGGSPFVACCNCFELLQMPEKSIGNTRKKIRCAACSEVILLSVVNKKLVTNCEKGVSNGNEKNRRRNTKWSIIESSSDDFDVSVDFDFRSLDRLPLGTRSLTSFKSTRSIRSSSSYTSEADADLAPIKDPKSESTKPSSPPSGSRLQDHFDYSTNSLQNSMKDAAVATEIEISASEYCVNTGTSQESVDQRNDTGGGRESFFVGMIKKSFKLSKLNQNFDNGKVNGTVAITVNGHSLPERLIKKAEKLSGPIQPGDYW
ncbi:uncharacterized protein LOC112526452 [Cynara cardunculus var. scolymus]|nr:uncharacterized protein LOC112526452 [Cynara cardunculus var. scolymus]